MRCKNVQHELSGFIDEVLNARITILISQHLDRCEECRREYRRLELLRKKLGKLDSPPYRITSGI
jgi:hypothetical protein